MRKSYDEVLHRHRFAAWCASTAASSSPNCRFSVEQGVRLIESCELQQLSQGWGMLPSASDFDASHRMWRERMIAVAPEIIESGEGRRFTAGVAAKLINCYLKPLYITGISELPLSPERRVLRDAIHPPVDRILLQTLAKENVGTLGPKWRHFASIGWSNFTHQQYEDVLDALKGVTNGRLWAVEEHWGGYRT
ncbi:hypothetical protein ACVWZK_001485 [Bradyrhizobium sp. GM0.4]